MNFEINNHVYGFLSLIRANGVRTKDSEKTIKSNTAYKRANQYWYILINI